MYTFLIFNIQWEHFSGKKGIFGHTVTKITLQRIKHFDSGNRI